jgi:uncharacterized integral membrane protein
MHDQGGRNPEPARGRGSQWVRRLMLAASNVIYAAVLIFARIILGSVGFRELLTTLELPAIVMAVGSVVLLGRVA